MSSPEGLSSSVSDPFVEYVFPSVFEERHTSHTSCCEQNYNQLNNNNNNNKCSSTQRIPGLQSNREYHIQSDLRNSYHSSEDLSHNVDESKLFETDLEACGGSGTEIAGHGYYFLHHNFCKSMDN
ncbi:unnamed protein product [Medioppia subpectinata]|uniref:Uncharacterized protein n=1 Tax=Medioppia subpectinata TaxID=1979941 RepID=A0A7R9KLZ3_9ACAR|nr:unnamed protein product [Medioppia subpectinata]CAG2106051.1 unnamed protein product [Medioppia subpectinata]